MPQSRLSTGHQNGRSFEIRVADHVPESQFSEAVWSLFLLDANHNILYEAHDQTYGELQRIAITYIKAGLYPARDTPRQSPTICMPLTMAKHLMEHYDAHSTPTEETDEVSVIRERIYRLHNDHFGSH